MATVNKDFKIKSGLIVEGTTATVNGYDILTKKPADDQYIIDLIGGETLVKSVSNEFDVSLAGELSIDRAVVDAYYDAAGDAAAAQAAAEATASADATSKANAAQAAAEATASADATSKANAAQAAAEATASADATSKANAAQAAAEATASSDATSKANAALASANTYTDGAVSALVDSAPELLNTLNELAEALGDSPDTITNLATLVGTKADTSYVDTEISDLDTAAQGYASAAQTAAETTASADATSKANAAQSAAEAYADGLAVNYEPAGSLTTAINALDTDSIEEATNLYFTDSRAKSSAADLILGASLTNIAITGNSTTGLIITAENGVADSDTDDLVEGSTNLYFQDSRALTAIEDANIQPSSIDITWVRREEATWTDVNTASQVVCHQAGGSEGSMKYLVRVTAQVGGVRHSHVTELLATVSGDNGVAVVEYGTIYTSENPLATATVLWNGLTNCYELNVTTANNNSEVMVAATLLANLD